MGTWQSGHHDQNITAWHLPKDARKLLIVKLKENINAIPKTQYSSSQTRITWKTSQLRVLLSLFMPIKIKSLGLL